MESGQMWILRIILHPDPFRPQLASACRCCSFTSLFFQAMCDYLEAPGKHKSLVACQMGTVIFFGRYVRDKSSCLLWQEEGEEEEAVVLIPVCSVSS